MRIAAYPSPTTKRNLLRRLAGRWLLEPNNDLFLATILSLAVHAQCFQFGVLGQRLMHHPTVVGVHGRHLDGVAPAFYLVGGFAGFLDQLVVLPLQVMLDVHHDLAWSVGILLV